MDNKAIYIDNYIIDTPIVDILNKLKSELTNGKLNYINVRDNENIQVTCPTHKDGHENKPSCNIYIGDNKPYGVYNCFTCGSKGPLWHFVAECFGTSDFIGKQWLIKNFGKLYSKPIVNLEPIELNKPVEETFLDETILNNFQSYHPYMDQRKLNRATCEKFKIKYDPETQSLVFPVWDKNGRLKFLTRRSVIDKQFHIDKGISKADIYLLNHVLDCPSVVVCEGQIDALTAWQYGLPSVALFGASTTDEQMETINNTPVKHWILVYDNDIAGNKGRKRFHDLIRKDIFVDDIILPTGKDINSLTKEEFDKYFINFKSI